MGFMADGGGVEQVTQLKPIYTKRDKKGYRFYVDVNDGNKIYAEKDGKLFKVNDDMKPSVPAVRAYQKQSDFFSGILPEEDFIGLNPLHYENESIKGIEKSYMKNLTKEEIGRAHV